MAAARLATVRALLLCLLLFSVLHVRKSECVTYSRWELLSLRNNLHAAAEIPISSFPAEILTSKPANDSCGHKTSRKHHRAGVLCRQRENPYRPTLPALLLTNVRSIKNKIDEFFLFLQSHKDYRDCSAICLTETWLDNTVPDLAVTPPGFSLHRVDRSVKLSNKTKGGGICLMINQRWCNNVKELSRFCSPYLEYMCAKCRPYYLPREFSSVILIGVYIPPSANANVATSELATYISSVENSHPDAVVIALGDFNHANLSIDLPNYTQQVTCPSRGSNILDHCYVPINDAYRSFPRAPLGKSDHAVLLLVPKYRQKLKSNGVKSKVVQCWSSAFIDTLRGCFECTNWDVFSAAAATLDELTDTVTSYVKFCVETCIPTKTVKTYSNNKPWFTKDIRTLHKKKNQAYTDGNESLYRAAKYELRAAIRKAKSKYANTLEKQIASNDTKSVWKKLKIMTDYKKSTAPPAVTDQDLPDKLNNFYGRFEQSSTPYAPPSPLPAPPFHIHEEEVRASFPRTKRGKQLDLMG
ncbi:hypothetical protein WMY93_008136 [Mugilogobius chulae]|uniref:Endonuclease/exonuclease/phosphatase domain-containing protein n=1 Tax=Mugilogobius chulae TaxID=88201 RepID=A0AAW0PF42_9GOBI